VVVAVAVTVAGCVRVCVFMCVCCVFVLFVLFVFLCVCVAESGMEYGKSGKGRGMQRVGWSMVSLCWAGVVVVTIVFLSGHGVGRRLLPRCQQQVHAPSVWQCPRRVLHCVHGKRPDMNNMNMHIIIVWILL
jgi:hypothetical protein